MYPSACPFGSQLNQDFFLSLVLPTSSQSLCVCSCFAVSCLTYLCSVSVSAPVLLSLVLPTSPQSLCLLLFCCLLSYLPLLSLCVCSCFAVSWLTYLCSVSAPVLLSLVLPTSPQSLCLLLFCCLLSYLPLLSLCVCSCFAVSWLTYLCSVSVCLLLFCCLLSYLLLLSLCVCSCFAVSCLTYRCSVSVCLLLFCCLLSYLPLLSLCVCSCFAVSCLTYLSSVSVSAPVLLSLWTDQGHFFFSAWTSGGYCCRRKL